MKATPMMPGPAKSLGLAEDKIIPFSLKVEEDSLLDRHIYTLKRAIEKVFGKELFSDDELVEKLPLVKWNECQKAPGAFVIHLLCFSHHQKEVHLFFHEMVSHWLVPGDQLQILSSRNLTFHLKAKGNRSYYFIELLVHVEKEKQLSLIHRNLPGFADEIKLGALSKGYARHILEMKRLSIGGKTSYIYETIVSAMRRHPKNFEHDIFREIQRFLIHCREEFREIRDMRHLCRVILSHYLFHRSILQTLKSSPDRRHLHFKLLTTYLHYPFGLKKVVGIAITLNSLRDYECFEERHILKAIQRILPDATPIQDSFYSHRHEDNKILSLYLEIEKGRDGSFSLQELILLRKKLGPELKNGIEYLSPSLFVPRNEEELYRNIISLSQELKYVHDLPQAIISFQEQYNDVLKFNVVLLRLLQPQSPSLQALSSLLPPQVRFHGERVTPVGTLRKKYVKEANVFTIEVENRLFLRKNHSVDLVKARQYVVHALLKLVGNFRDYNGGFLLKQNEQLESIKKEWGEEAWQNEFLIENLFYSLSPSIMQTLIPPAAGKAFCDLFLKCIDLGLGKQEALRMEKVHHDHSLSCVIKTRENTLKEKIAPALKELEIAPLKLACAMVEHEGYYYLCILYLHPQEQECARFLEVLELALSLLIQKQLSLQVVRLHLPHAAQSLDPRIGVDRTSGIVIRMLYEGLMRVAKQGGVECAIAEHVEVSPDGKRYTFTLRETKWSNGSPLTAYDFEYAWKKILEPTFRSPYSFLLFPILNAEKGKQGEVPLSEIGITVQDSKTLIVDLEYPAPYFLDLMAHWTYSPLCCELDQRHPGWAYQSAETHVSNGPFKLDLWKLNDDMTVVKNPLYWDAPSVHLDKIEVSIIEDQNMAFDLFNKGELDWVGDPIWKIPYLEVPRLSQKGLVETSDLRGFFWLQMNSDHALFSNASLRKAFAHALDRKKLIDTVLQRDDEPALRFNMTSSCPRKTFIRAHDFEYARELFAQGLGEAGLKKGELPPLIFTHSTVAEHEALSQAIGREWSSVLGIEVKFERVHWNSYFDMLCRQDFMVGGLSWYSRYDDPLYYLDLLVPRENAHSVSKWRDPAFIELIHAAKHARGEKRRELIDQAEDLVLEAMPLIPIMWDRYRYIKNPRLKDVILSTIGQIDFREAYVHHESAH